MIPYAGVVLHVGAALAVALLSARLGGRLAGLLRQPPVIGEIVVGLLAGPAILALVGRPGLELLLPDDVAAVLRLVGKVGVTLYLVGVAHHLDFGRTRIGARTIVVTVTGALLVPLLLGGLLGGWVLLAGDPALRGGAPPMALVMMLAVVLSVTAVPVLARILADHRLQDTEPGRLAMTTAVVVDGLSWLLLGVAVGLAWGGLGKVGIGLAVLGAALSAALLSRRLLRDRVPSWHPRATALALAGVAVAAAATMERWGLTGVIGAVLVGLAIPGRGRGAVAWAPAVARVGQVGSALVPVFFVVAGIDVFTGESAGVAWPTVVVVTTLAIVGKVGGGYLGARLGGRSHRTATAVGVMLNTRGMTELVVLQAGYSAEILTAEMFLALTVMALFTTALTGPVLRAMGLADPPGPHPPPVSRRAPSAGSP